MQIVLKLSQRTMLFHYLFSYLNLKNRQLQPVLGNLLLFTTDQNYSSLNREILSEIEEAALKYLYN